jgi:hypothetical protein
MTIERTASALKIHAKSEMTLNKGETVCQVVNIRGTSSIADNVGFPEPDAKLVGRS